MAGSVRGAEEPPKLVLSRSDLANAYLRFDHAYANSPPAPERIAAINRQFDAETRAFFGGNLAQVARGVNALAAEIQDQGKPLPNQAFADSLKIKIEPRAFVENSTAPIHVWIRPVYKVDPMPTTDVPMTLRLLKTGDSPVLETPILVPPERLADEPLRVELPPAAGKLPVGKYSVEIAGNGFRNVVAETFFVVPFDVDQRREANEKRLANVSPSTPALTQALAACKARNSLLVSKPSESNSAEFLADPNELARSLEGEIASLLEGKDPYVGRMGDYWRVVQEGEIAIPARVFAPPSIEGKSAVPLVIAFHGAGGDENMFMDAYGAGKLKQLAQERGFLAVAPATFYFATHGKYFDRLVEAIGFNYPIDPARIYVLGHSMGGGAAAYQAKARAETLAAACCLAGGRGFPTSGACAPTLVIAAELDGIVPAEMLRAGAEDAIQAGMPIEFRLLKDYGHTLMVGHQLPDAIDWLLSRHRNPPSPSTQGNERIRHDG